MSDDSSRLSAQLNELAEQVRHLGRTTDEIRALIGPFGVPMPDQRMLVQTLHGVKYLIDPSDLIMGPQLIIYRQWEPELSALFLELLNQDSIVIDVGANFGYFTCLAGTRIGRSGRGRVVAVEPNPAMLELLHANCAINWSMAPIEVHAAAAGPSSGEAMLHVPRNRAANASLTGDSASGDLVAVKMVALDDLVQGPVDLLKIDVEGHEAGVLQGARNLIASSPNLVVVMEWSLEQLAAAGRSAEDMLLLFDELGLVPYWAPLTARLVDAQPAAAETLIATPYANLLLRPHPR